MRVNGETVPSHGYLRGADSRAAEHLLLAALAALFLGRLLFTWWVNLIPDECSYWAWSRRPDWSYFDNSGMVAYLIRLSTDLFGVHTPFSVRCPFLLWSALSTYLLFRVTLLLYGDRFRALLTATVFNLTPLALLGGSAAMHDNALVFFWMLSLWAAARFIRSGRHGWFYVMGAAAGGAILSKYTGILAVASILLFLLWVPENRRLLFRKEPWIGAVIALLCTVPIIWWNMNHQWASLNHILYIGSGAASGTRRLLDGLGYHAAQFLLVSPLFYWALVLGVKHALYRNLMLPEKEDALLLCFSLPLLLFGILAFKGHVEANWTFMGYAPAAIIAIETTARVRRLGHPSFGEWYNPRFLRWGTIIAVVPALAVILHAWVGLLPADVERKFAKEDRIIWETRGWKGLGEHVGRLANRDDLIAADAYQLCALLEFNVPGNPEVRYLAPWNRPTQFDVWEPSFDNLHGRNILFVSAKPLRPSSDALTTIFESFARVEPLPSYHVSYHGEAVRELYLYRGYGFDPFTPRRLGPRSLLYRDK